MDTLLLKNKTAYAKLHVVFILNAYMQKLQYLQATQEMIPELTRFLGLSDISFWDYEYRNYMPDKSVFSVVLRKGLIVGSQAYMPYLMNINGSVFLAGRSERTKLDKSLTGGKIFPLLMENCASHGENKDMAFSWGFTTAKKAFQRAGYYSFSGFLEHAFLTLDFKNALKSIYAEREKKLRYAKIITLAFSHILSVLFGGAYHLFKKSKAITIKKEPLNTHDIARLYERIRGKYSLIHIEQDNQFIQWAFNSGKRIYLKYYAYDGNNLVAYIILDITTRDTAYLADFAFINASSFYNIWRQIRPDLKKIGTGFVRTAYNVKNKILANESKTLHKIGFMPIYRGAIMVVRPLKFKDINILGDISAWYVTPFWSILHTTRNR